MSYKGINIKDRDFILYNTPPKVGKSYISYIDIIDQLVEENKDLKNKIKKAKQEINNAYTNIDNCKNVNYMHVSLKKDLLDIFEESDKNEENND